MKKKVLVTMMITVLTASMLAGCSSTGSNASAAEIESSAEAAPAEDASAEDVAEDAAEDEDTAAAEDTASSGESDEPVSDQEYFQDLTDAHEMLTDIEGCDTFTQIVNKLDEGQGYANAVIGETDVLLVASGTYDNLDGNQAAIDAEVFCYDENGAPAYMGFVQCGGTAYPLAVKDGYLYACGNHFVTKYTARDGRIEMYENLWEMFDSDGNAGYSYNIEGNMDEVPDLADGEEKLSALYDEYAGAEIINFTVVAR